MALSPEHQSARMSKIKNGGLDQYGAKPFEQRQFGTDGVEGVNFFKCLSQLCWSRCLRHDTHLHRRTCRRAKCPRWRDDHRRPTHTGRMRGRRASLPIRPRLLYEKLTPRFYVVRNWFYCQPTSGPVRSLGQGGMDGRSRGRDGRRGDGSAGSDPFIRGIRRQRT